MTPLSADGSIASTRTSMDYRWIRHGGSHEIAWTRISTGNWAEINAWKINTLAFLHLDDYRGIACELQLIATKLQCVAHCKYLKHQGYPLPVLFVA